MRRKGASFLALAALLVGSGAARGEERAAETKGEPAAARPNERRAPVRVRATSVTVVDEGESVDDVITRLRDVRLRRPEEPKRANPPAREKQESAGAAPTRRADGPTTAAAERRRMMRERVRARRGSERPVIEGRLERRR